MIKKRILLLIFYIYSTCVIFAQAQQGYVKTLGRPNQKGTALSGVTIRAKGAHNTVLSNAKGTFSIPMAGKKNGDAYSLQQIQKQGYELNETGVIGRQYAFSDKVPLNIVMVSTKQLQEDKLRIENKAYEVAEKAYKSKLDLLEKQKKNKEITENNFRNQLRTLQDKYAKYQSLIDELANHYVHVDYDNLNETEKKINMCIENGEIEQADSLLHTIFDPTDILKRNQNALSALDKQLSEATALKEKAEAEMATILIQQEKDAEYLYQLFSISLARFDNEKARFYIETRAELDKNNAEWQLDAGEFIDDYLNDEEKARTYYDDALKICSKNGDELNMARAYNNIGITLGYNMKTEEGMQLLTKALEIRQRILGEDHPLVATCYNNMGGCMAVAGDNNKCIEYYEKGLQIRLKVLGENNESTAKSYTNLGAQLGEMGEIDKAIEHTKKAISIAVQLKNEYTRFAATCYDNLGVFYNQKGMHDLALVNCKKSLAIRKKMYGENHEDVAMSYNNIAIVYYALGGDDNYQQAINYYTIAIQKYTIVRGNSGYFIANCRQNLGYAYYNTGHYDKAAIEFKKAIKAYEESVDSNYISIAKTYEALADVYCMKDDLERRLEARIKAEAIYEANGDAYRLKAAELCNAISISIQGEEMNEKKNFYNNKAYYLIKDRKGEDYEEKIRIADLLANVMLKKDINKAITYFIQSLSLRIELYGNNDPKIAEAYENVAMAYSTKNCIKEVEEYFNKAESIIHQISDTIDNQAALQILYFNKGVAYNNMELDSLSFIYHQKSLILQTTIFKELGIKGNDYSMVSDLEALWEAAYKRKWYNEALKYSIQEYKIKKRVLGENNPETVKVQNRVALMYVLVAIDKSYKGKYEFALDYFLKAKAIIIKNKGENSEDAAIVNDYINDVKRIINNE